jgi:hypothetical protein
MSRRALSRGVGAAIIVALAVGLVIVRCRDGGERGRRWRDEGVRALLAGLEGERAGFARAEEAFAKGAGGVLFDPFPVFALEVSRVLDELTGRPAGVDLADAFEVSEVSPEARPVFLRWVERRYDLALVEAARLPDTLAGAGLLMELASGLVRARAERDAVRNGDR